MTKKRIIKLNFQIYGSEDQISIECEANKPISEYKDKITNDKKYSKFVFGNQDGAFIDEKTSCRDLEDLESIILYPNGLNNINIIILNEDNTQLDQIKMKSKLSSTVDFFKEKLLEKLDSKENDLKPEDIQVKVDDKILDDDAYIFSYKGVDDLTVQVIIPGQVDEAPLKYFFQFPDEDVRDIEISQKKTFAQINELEEFKDQDYIFYFDDEEIDKKSKISEYTDAQKEDTPIQLKINYFIQLIAEGSKSKPQELHHAFSLTQKIKEVLDELAVVVEERRKLLYNDKEYDEDSLLSKIKYKKGTPLVIKILPVKYTFQFENTTEDEEDNKFKLPICGDMTVEDVIELIKAKKKIDDDIVICTGGKTELKEHEPDETMSNFRESETITIKKLDLLYTITFNGKEEEKRIPSEYTVKDLLKSNKKYKSRDDRKKIIVKSEDNVLDENELLSDLSSKEITIELSDPIYQFQLEDSEPVEVPIPDNIKYGDAISLVKKNIKQLKKIENERIEFELKSFEFNSEILFGPDIPYEKPINIKIVDPAYIWLLKENKEEKGEKKEYVFPTEFSIGDAASEIEKGFKYKCSIKIYTIKNKILTKINKDENVYEEYYKSKCNICVVKFPVKFTFTLNETEYTQKFDINDALVKVSNYLCYDEEKKSLDFKDTPSYFEFEDRLEFKYKGKVLKLSDTFDSLNYNPYGKETIQINLLPPKYSIYSLKSSERIECDGDSLKINEIKIPEDDNVILYDNFQPIKKKVKINNYTTIDCFSYQTKVDFNFSVDPEIDEYSIYINDEDITIDEVKTLVAAHIAKSQDKKYGQGRICLKYKDKEITKELFKEIKYKEGNLIDVSIKNCQFRVKIKKEVKIIELDDDHMTVGDLKGKIEKNQRYIMKYRNKELKETQDLKELHISKNDCIDAEVIKTKVLSYEGKEYKLDDLDLNSEKKLRKHFRKVFEIDVDNSKFLVGDNEIELNDFKELPEGAKVKVETKLRKFKNFKDEKLNNIFKTNNSIRDVRQHIYEEDGENKLPVRIKSGDKFLLNKTKLFQVDGEIKIEKVKDDSVKKILIYPEDLEIKDPVTENFDCETTGEELKAYVKSYVPNEYPFELMFEDSKIDDDDIICEFGDEIHITPLVKEDSPKNKVNFTVIKSIKKKSKNVDKEFIYSEDKEIEYYAKKLDLDDDYICFERGKLLSKDKQVKFYKDEEIQKVYVFPYKEVDSDEFNETARCAFRVEKPQLKIDEIVVNDVAASDKDDPNEGQVIIKYEPMSIFDLRKKVAFKLGFKKEAGLDRVGLFIPFASRDVTEFALLSDKEDVATVLTENSGYNIHFKILKVVPPLRANRIKKYREYSQKSGIILDDEQIQEIYKKVEGNFNLFLSSIDYMASKV